MTTPGLARPGEPGGARVGAEAPAARPGDSVRTKNTLIPTVVGAEREQRAGVVDGRARRDRDGRVRSSYVIVPSAMPPRGEHGAQLAEELVLEERRVACAAVASSAAVAERRLRTGWSSKFEEVEVEIEDDGSRRA